MTTPNDVFARAHDFLLTHARLLERRIFEVRFEAGEPTAVEAAVRAYQNRDGGLGDALEPDLRTTTSQPIFAEVGLSALEAVGLRSPALAKQVGGQLAALAGSGGLLPAILDNALTAPHAAHWRAPSWLEPGPNPSFGICGLLHYHGYADPWLDDLTQTCVSRLRDDAPRESHALLSALSLVSHLPDREVAATLATKIAEALPEAEFFIADPVSEGYGLTPLHFAPGPGAPLRDFFDSDSIDAHLKALLARQEQDGGWPITWEAPGPAAVCEWRGRLTLAAISSLCAYEIISPS